jgi:hypothetical protein
MPIVENSKVNSSVCKLCGKKFASFAEMQQHITIDHMQRGDISTAMMDNSNQTDDTKCK